MDRTTVEPILELEEKMEAWVKHWRGELTRRRYEALNEYRAWLWYLWLNDLKQEVANIRQQVQKLDQEDATAWARRKIRVAADFVVSSGLPSLAPAPQKLTCRLSGSLPTSSAQLKSLQLSGLGLQSKSVWRCWALTWLLYWRDNRPTLQ